MSYRPIRLSCATHLFGERSVLRQPAINGTAKSRPQLAHVGISINVAKRKVRAHAVADAPLLHVFPDRDDLTGEIGAWNQVLLFLGERVLVE